MCIPVLSGWLSRLTVYLVRWSFPCSSSIVSVTTSLKCSKGDDFNLRVIYVYTQHSNIFLLMCVKRVSRCYVNGLPLSRASQSAISFDPAMCQASIKVSWRGVTWLVTFIPVLANRLSPVCLTSLVFHPSLGFVSCPLSLHFPLGLPSVSWKARWLPVRLSAAVAVCVL